MRVLVTGGSGFLGSHIIDACLAQGDDVVALVRRSSDLSYLKTLPRVELRAAELTDAASLAAVTREVEVVYHAAARVTDYGSRARFIAANVRGTEHLLRAAQRTGAARFVFISTPSVVADGTHQVNIDESYPIPRRFQNLYSATKAEAEALVLASNTPDFITCALRPRAVWGPRDRQGFMPKIVAKLLAGRLRKLSRGEPVLASLCYCENAALACVQAARSPKVGGRAYFIADDEVVDVWPFIDEIAAMFGAPAVRGRVSPAVLRVVVALVEALWAIPALGHHRSPPVSRYSVSLLTCSATFDTAAARRDFGYEPRVSQAEGFRRLRTWIDAIGGVAAFVQHVKDGQ